MRAMYQLPRKTREQRKDAVKGLRCETTVVVVIFEKDGSWLIDKENGGYILKKTAES